MTPNLTAFTDVDSQHLPDVMVNVQFILVIGVLIILIRTLDLRLYLSSYSSDYTRFIFQYVTSVSSCKHFDNEESSIPSTLFCQFRCAHVLIYRYTAMSV